MDIIPKLNQAAASPGSINSSQPASAIKQFTLTEEDCQQAKQYLISVGEWLVVYLHDGDKQKIIETANNHIKQNGWKNNNGVPINTIVDKAKKKN
ncbi:MAG: hypothetical protein ACU84H_13635 [Gammaproteobacteria bacterium]